MAEWVAAAVAVAGLGYSIHAGEQQQRQQKRAVRRQQGAQEQAVAQAARAQKMAQEQQALANRQTPDPSEILMSEYEMGRRSGGTLLTGARPDELKRGSSLLGE